MRFVFSAVYITLKRSVSVILCASLCLALIAAAFSAALPAVKYEPVKIAVVNLDGSAAMLPLITSMLESRLGGLLKAETVDAGQPTDGYPAVLVLPDGFFESVMNGENLAPQLTVNAFSAFEGLWLSSLAKSAASVITKAQNVVGAVNVAADSSGLSADERDRVIMSLNAHLLNDYLTRKGRFESITLSATGKITAVQHYISAAASFLCFVMAFLLFSPIKELQKFAALSGKKCGCLLSALISCMLISLLLTALAAAAMGGADNVISFDFIKAALLLFSVLIFFPSVTDSAASCASLCCACCLFQAVFGGAVLPDALLPEALADISRFFPLSVFRKALADTAYRCGFDGTAILFCWCVVLTSASVLWRLRKEERI